MLLFGQPLRFCWKSIASLGVISRIRGSDGLLQDGVSVILSCCSIESIASLWVIPK